MSIPPVRPGMWKKSSFTNTDNCVETKLSEGADSVNVRDTKDRLGGQLAFPAAAFVAFTGMLKDSHQ